MAEPTEKTDKIAEVENTSGQDEVSRTDAETGTPAVKGGTRGLQPPEFLRHMSMEERLELERKLKRKIDMRLLPCIILMYILNYIDRYETRMRAVISVVLRILTRGHQEQHRRGKAGLLSS